jgi:prevent-host-death family protein
MPTYNIHDAKTHFSKLLERVANGEEVIIAKAGKPVAQLVAVEKNQLQRKPGNDAGKIFIAPDFDDPLEEFNL